MKQTKWFRALALAAASAAVFAALAACSGGSPAAQQPSGGDLVIAKASVSEKATFLPYQAGGTKIEIIAVKAPDGTIRTAFNTCQVCFDSGRGYYVQQGDELVCQNCGNRFRIDRIEKQKNGCNPVPILEENKKDDGTTITIPAAFLNDNRQYFANWKTN